MKLLLHTCCAPCLIYPLDVLRQARFDVTVFFYNPNIHPFLEFKKRVECLVNFTKENNITSIIDNHYGLIDFTRKVTFNEDNRCKFCYDIRLEKTVILAKKEGYTAFSSTLLYSKFQKHSLIKKKCTELAKKYCITFYYTDFRDGWQLGIDKAIAADLYRQPYCGCIYSEQERYDKSLRKRNLSNN